MPEWLEMIILILLTLSGIIALCSWWGALAPDWLFDNEWLDEEEWRMAKLEDDLPYWPEATTEELNARRTKLNADLMAARKQHGLDE